MFRVLAQWVQPDPAATLDSRYRLSYCRLRETACVPSSYLALQNVRRSWTAVPVGASAFDEWLQCTAMRVLALLTIADKLLDQVWDVSFFNLPTIVIGAAEEMIRNFRAVRAVHLRESPRPPGATQKTGRIALRKLVFGRLRTVRDGRQLPVMGLVT